MTKLISIITVTYNCRTQLEKTFQSLHAQTYQEYEHIVIDGLSSDGTVDLIVSNQDKIGHWVSERDRGIYDAMNKGIAAAQGIFLQFLNAGDTFFNEDSLEQVVVELKNSHQPPDVVFGEIMIVDPYVQQKMFHARPLGFTLEIVKNRGTAGVNHQSFFIRKDLVPLYSLQYRLKAELNWYIDILKKHGQQLNIASINAPLITYQAGGAGNIHYLRNLFEWVMVTWRQFGVFQVLKNIQVFTRYLSYSKKVRRILSERKALAASSQ